jgi:threonine dehydratase
MSVEMHFWEPATEVLPFAQAGELPNPASAAAEALQDNPAARQVGAALEALQHDERLARFYEVVRVTPLIAGPGVASGYDVRVKNEGEQEGNAYKLRGATAKILAAQARGEKISGIVAFSTGNHANETGIAGRALGVSHVEAFCPGDTVEAKLNSMRANGVTPNTSPASLQDARAAAEARGREPGMLYIHPFNDPEVIAGQATAALEAMAQLAAEGLDPHDPANEITVVVPAGGGGLAAGTVVALAAHYPNARVLVSQLEGGDGIGMARRGETPDPTMFNYACRGAAVCAPGKLPLEILNDPRFGVELPTVSMAELYESMALLEQYHKRPEAAGALAMAAARQLGLGETSPDDGRRHVLVAITSGTNSSPEEDAELRSAWLQAERRKNAAQFAAKQVMFTALSREYAERPVYGLDEILARQRLVSAPLDGAETTATRRGVHRAISGQQFRRP